MQQKKHMPIHFSLVRQARSTRFTFAPALAPSQRAGTCGSARPGALARCSDRIPESFVSAHAFQRLVKVVKASHGVKALFKRHARGNHLDVLGQFARALADECTQVTAQQCNQFINVDLSHFVSSQAKCLRFLVCDLADLLHHFQLSAS
jgi:hypothetical protein